jgi:hypothetical protein
VLGLARHRRNRYRFFDPLTDEQGSYQIVYAKLGFGYQAAKRLGGAGAPETQVQPSGARA